MDHRLGKHIPTEQQTLQKGHFRVSIRHHLNVTLLSRVNPSLFSEEIVSTEPNKPFRLYGKSIVLIVYHRPMPYKVLFC